MAVDTRADRQRAHRASNRWARIWPHPDGSLATEDDRAHMLGFYGSLTAEVLLVAPRNALGPDTVYRHLAADTLHRHLGSD